MKESKKTAGDKREELKSMMDKGNSNEVCSKAECSMKCDGME